MHDGLTHEKLLRSCFAYDARITAA